MNTTQRRVTFAFSAVAVGLFATALLPSAVAYADNYDFTPNITTFAPTQVEGYPPLINEVTGTEQWDLTDLTTNAVKFPNVLIGTDTQTTIGSFTNDDFLNNVPLILDGPGPGEPVIVSAGSQVDLANFGAGFENEWIDIAGTGSPDNGVSDLLITPFGDFSLLGSAFTDISSTVG